MTKLAFIFPGQGSQSVGMMSDWGDYQSQVDRTFQEASEALGYNLQKIVSEGPSEQLNQTETTQPAMLASGVATYRIWQAAGLKPAEIVSGHSLGEYTALVCSNSLDFSDAIKLVARRGQLMQNAVAEGEGAMAAIIGLDDQDVIQACAMVDKGIVSAVNFNSPGQVVIAGNAHSVERAMENAKELGAKRALPLPVSVPSHCDLMKDAADSLYQELLNVPLNVPDIPVIHNQSADQARDVDEIRQLLKLQLYQPVLWVQCVQQLVAKGATDLIEMGPGKVLSGLTRRINKSLGSHPVYDLASLEKTQQNLEDE